MGFMANTYATTVVCDAQVIFSNATVNSISKERFDFSHRKDDLTVIGLNNCHIYN